MGVGKKALVNIIPHRCMQGNGKMNGVQWLQVDIPHLGGLGVIGLSVGFCLFGWIGEAIKGSRNSISFFGGGDMFICR